MTGTLVVVALTPVAWAPPGVAAAAWREAMAEDMIDLLHALAGVDTAVAAAPTDLALAWAVRWPTMRSYRLDHPARDVADAAPQLLAAAAADGYQRAAVLCADAPDLPAMLIGKLLRPLTTRPVALTPAVGGGLLAVAAQLPAPDWLVAGLRPPAAAGASGGDPGVAGGLPGDDPGGAGVWPGDDPGGAGGWPGGDPGGAPPAAEPAAVDRVRRAAPAPGQVGVGPAWHRLRSAGDLGRLDPGLEGWEATRLLLGH